MRDEERIFTKGSGLRDAPQAPRWFAWDGNTQDVPTAARKKTTIVNRASKKSGSTESPFSTPAPKQVASPKPASAPARPKPAASSAPTRKKSSNAGCVTMIIIAIMILISLNFFGFIGSVIEEQIDSFDGFGTTTTQEQMEDAIDNVDGDILFKQASECVYCPDDECIYIPDGYYDRDGDFWPYSFGESQFNSYKKAKKYVLDEWGEEYHIVFDDTDI